MALTKISNQSVLPITEFDSAVTFNNGIQLGGTGSENRLSGYEIGTWTPKITGSSGSTGQSYTQDSGRYTKIGRFVYLTYDVGLSNAGNLSGTYLTLGNLPFTPMGNNHGGSVQVTYFSGFQNLANDHISGYIAGTIAFLVNGSANYIRVADGNHTATSRLIGSAWFMQL